jgi:hypothetical protein
MVVSSSISMADADAALAAAAAPPLSFVAGIFNLGEPWGEAALRACVEGLARALHPPSTGEHLWAQLLVVAAASSSSPLGRGCVYGGPLPRPLRVRLCTRARHRLFSEEEGEGAGALCLTAVDPSHRQERSSFLLYAGELLLELSNRQWRPCASLAASPLFVFLPPDSSSSSRHRSGDQRPRAPTEVTVRLPCLYPLHQGIGADDEAAMLLLLPLAVAAAQKKEKEGLLVVRAGRGATRAVARAVGDFKSVFNLL